MDTVSIRRGVKARGVAARGLVVLAALASASCPGRRTGDEQRPGPAVNWPFFHGSRARRGWNASETSLGPAQIANGHFGPVWESERFDTLETGGQSFPPLCFASPLYVDDVSTPRGDLSLVVAATTNGDVYAINAFARGGVPAGAVVWRQRITQAAPVPALDGGLPLGVLSTPAIDLDARPPILYVAASDARAGWQVHALALGDGTESAGWPVTLDAATVTAHNRNAPAGFESAEVLSQRGALALSPRGDRVYVPFGAYLDGGVGWLVAVDTLSARVVHTFSGGHAVPGAANGGIWSAAGVSVDEDGSVYATTGNGPSDGEDLPGNWGQSLLRFDRDLTLTGSYTPFNHCAMDLADTDLGGSSPVLIPGAAGATFVAFGGKQGSVYLLDRRGLPGRVDVRPPCSMDPASDASLLPPEVQPHFGTRGPLNVFGPYSERFGNLDSARMRSTPAYFRDASQRAVLYVSGSAKATEASQDSVAPCLARLRVVEPDPARPAASYLALDGTASDVACANPGSPVVTSAPDGSNAVVWVIDANSRRVASLRDPTTPHPVLYVFDGATMRLLWRSDPGWLALTGKYITAVVAHGRVFLATDRIQTFGLR